VSDPDAPPLNTRALLDALARHQVSFVAVGGLAAQWQGAQRHTKERARSATPRSAGAT
jgi:hypothetical protein